MWSLSRDTAEIEVEVFDLAGQVAAEVGLGRKRERRGERPRSCGAANRGYEFSPIDMDCHVTLRLGVIHAMDG